MAMKSYQYEPLQYPDAIRLVAIQPGTLDDPTISCHIVHTRLSEPMLFYEALSYTWGDASDRVAISIGETAIKLDVTRTCYNALLNLRKENQLRLVWIDAICIDQGNLAERSSQVNMMGRIYESAEVVIAYLGEETAGSLLVFQELRLLDKDLFTVEPQLRADDSINLGSIQERVSQQPRIGNGTNFLAIRERVSRRPKLGNDFFRELDALLDRPWFERMWVVQEAFNSRRLVIKCGRSQANFAALQCYIWNGRSVNPKEMPFVLDYFHDLDDPSIPIEHKTAVSLWRILGNTRSSKATDPRDRIFALKSLILPSSSRLEEIITYERSVERVFLDTALFLLPTFGLWILLAVRHPHSLPMPSWVPDWSQNSSAPHFTTGMIPDELHTRMDEPSHLGFKQPSPEGCEGSSQSAVPDNNASYIRNGFVIRNIECCGHCCQNPHKVLCVEGDEISRIVSLSAIFDFKAKKELAFASLQQARKLSKLEDITEELSSNFLIPSEIVKRLYGMDEFCFRSFLGRGEWCPRFGDWTEVFTDFDWGLYFERSLHMCVIYMDDSGCLGIAPKDARLGDMICELRGAKKLCLLRERSEGGWHVISGDGYIEENRGPLGKRQHYTKEFAIW